MEGLKLIKALYVVFNSLQDAGRQLFVEKDIPTIFDIIAHSDFPEIEEHGVAHMVIGVQPEP